MTSDGKAMLDATSRVKASLHAARVSWVPLGDEGRRVQIMRPDEADFPRFRGGVTVDHVTEYVVAWDGFTEATFLGAAIGASDALDFDADLWKDYARDHVDEAMVVAAAIADAIKARIEARGLAAKN